MFIYHKLSLALITCIVLPSGSGATAAHDVADMQENKADANTKQISLTNDVLDVR